jgi:hypothetical protein
MKDVEPEEESIWYVFHLSIYHQKTNIMTESKNGIKMVGKIAVSINVYWGPNLLFSSNCIH